MQPKSDPNDFFLQTINKLEEKKIIRKHKIKALEDWLGFIVRVLFGICFFVVGGSEWLAPELLPIDVPNPTPPVMTAIGLGVLSGRQVLKKLASIIELWGKGDV